MTKLNKKLFRILLLVNSVLVGFQVVSTSSSQKRGLLGDSALVAKAHSLVRAMGGQAVWSELQTLHLRHRLLYVGTSVKMIENEYYDLAGPREYAEVRSETKELKRASGPGVGWIWRDGKLTNHPDAEIQKAVKGAPGLIWRIVRRIALNDPTLEVKGNSTRPNRLEFYDASTLLCWIDIDASGAPVLWGAPDVDRISGPPDVEWVWGPLKTFGTLRIPAWGAYTSGEFRLEMLDVQGSPKPFSKSLEPPTPTGNEDADEMQLSNPKHFM